MKTSAVATNIRATLIALLIAAVFPLLGKAQIYYPNRVTNIAWSPGNFVTVADIQAAFNNARTNENGLTLGAGQVIMPMMTMPTQGEWDGKSSSLKGLWLMNSERVARGILPLQDVDINAISIAQAHANYLRTNDVFCHTCPGAPSPHNLGPWDRLDTNPAINGHHDFLGAAENLYAAWGSGTVPLPVEQAIYGWIYVDSTSTWGHRRAILFTIDPPANNNYGDAGSEGLMGIGLATGPYSGSPAGAVVVYNIFDPDASYNPALPVQLSSFTGNTTTERHVRLRWTTVSEINNYGFFVQRRASVQGEFVDLPNSFLPGHGTTNVPQQYEFVDGAPLQGAGLYRLKQVDLDGSIHHSDEISISTLTGVSEHAPVEFSLKQNYPNPFNPSTTLQFDLPIQGRVNLSVYDVLGKEVAQVVAGEMGAGTHLVQFDAKSLASGVYSYRIQVEGENGASFSAARRMVVMK
jgi:hypothetical protein